MKLIALLFVLAVSPASADVARAIDDHILPGYTAFADATAALSGAAEAGCTDDPVKSAYQQAFDAWMAVSHLRLGPVEDNGRYVNIAYWPDTRGATPKALGRLVAEEDPIIGTPAGVARLSVAARGFYALEYLLYGDEDAGPSAYSCQLVAALSADLAAIAESVLSEWQTGYSETLRTAGAADNAVYFSEREAKQALFTALSTGLEFTSDQRLGRPLGTYDRPRPTRAEAWRAGRSQRNVELSLLALLDLKSALLDADTPETDAAFARAIELVQALDDPRFSGVEDPLERIRIEALQQSVQTLRQALLTEAGAALGVAPGFNSADGD